MKDCDWIKVGYAHCRFITKLKTRCNNLLLNTLHSVPSHHPVRKPIQTIYSLNICSHQLTTPPTHLPFPPFTHQVVRKIRPVPLIIRFIMVLKSVTILSTSGEFGRQPKRTCL